jgi:hypothetical protein
MVKSPLRSLIGQNRKNEIALSTVRSNLSAPAARLVSSAIVDAYFSIQSPHLATGSLPHGMIGTDEVEFFGDPSMIRSLYTM